MIYILIILFFISQVYKYDIKNNKKNEHLYFKIDAIIIILLYGFRYHIGADSFNYMDLFPHYPDAEQLHNQGFSNLDWQPGWYIANAAVKIIIDEFWFFNLLHSLFVNTVVFVTINRYSKHKFSAVLVYFVCMSPYVCTEILRESISVSFFLLSIPYLQNKKWLKYYLFSVLAYSFHASSIFLFVLPLLYWLLIKEFKIKYIILSSIFVVCVSAHFSDYIIYIQQFLGGVTGSKLYGYYMSQVALQESMTGLFGTGIPGSWILSLFMYPLVLHIMRNLHLVTPLNNFIINMQVVLNFFSYFLGLISERGANYFNLIFYIILVDVLYNAYITYKSGINRCITTLVLAFFLLWLPYRYYFRIADQDAGTKAYKLYYPYSSIFFPENDMQREQLGNIARDS